jgi:hypothetical protein
VFLNFFELQPQTDSELSAFAFFTFNIQFSSMCIYNIIAQTQTKTSWLGIEESLEDFVFLER